MDKVLMEYALVPQDLLTKHENHQGNVISLEGAEGEEGEETGAARYLTEGISLSTAHGSIAHGSIGSGQVEIPAAAGDIVGFSSCCLPGRCVFLGGSLPFIW